MYKLALLFAGSWAGILTARVIDRLGKGIRTAPRDVMVSESAEDDTMGKAFGVHKALDMAGSALGIILSYMLLRGLAGGFTSGIGVGGTGSGMVDTYRLIFMISIAPTILALVMFAFVKEKKEPRQIKEREKFWTGFSSLDGRLKLYLLIVFLFTLGNSSNTFLLLRAKSAGFDDTNVILLYFLYNLTASVVAVPFG